MKRLILSLLLLPSICFGATPLGTATNPPVVQTAAATFTIQTGVTTTFNSGSITTFASGSTVNFTGATVTGLSGPINTGKTLWVDSVNGNDSTGTRGRLDKPFLTLAAAKTAANSGDTISVGPGSFTTTVSLLKNGVNWYFSGGSIVTATSDTVYIFDDGGTPITSTVSGFGAFIQNPADTSGGAVSLIKVTNASSDVEIEGYSFTTNGSDGGECSVVRLDAGTLRVRAFVIAGRTLDGATYAVWWNNGQLDVSAFKISGYYGVYTSVTATPTGDAFIQCDTIYADYPFVSSGTHASAACWLRAITVQSIDGQALTSFSTASNKLYLEAEKIFGGIETANGGTALVYVNAQKHSAIANGTATHPSFVKALSGTLRYEVGHIDPATFTGDSITVAGATATIRGGEFTALSAGKGFQLSSGTLTLTNTLIDTSANSSTSAIIVSGGTLNAHGCWLTSNASGYDVNRSAGTANIINGRGTNAIGTFTTNGTVNFVSINALKGANSDITSLSGLTTALSVTQGGTGITSFGSGIATFLGTPSVANFKTALSDETTVVGNLFSLANPSAISFIKIAADNTVSTRTPAQVLSDIGAGTGDALVANPLSQFAATTSAQLRGVLSDENGTGAALFSGATSPVFVTPDLGTPSALVVTNASGTASININGTVGATTPAAGTFTTGVFGSTTSLLLGTAGSAVGNIGFRNATSGTATLAPPTGALGAYTVTLPNAASTLPISGQQITWSGPTAARTYTLPDAAATLARTDAAQTFTGTQTFGTIKASTIVAPSDSTTAIQITKADGTTVLENWDSTNTRKTIGSTGNTNYTGVLNIAGANSAYKGNLTIIDTGFASSSSSCSPTITGWGSDIGSTTTGRMWFMGMSGAAPNNVAFGGSTNVPIDFYANNAQIGRWYASSGLYLGTASYADPGAGNLTISGGTLTGGASGLSLAAGGSNQNITLTPSGTGIISFAKPISITGAVGQSAITVTGATQTTSFPMLDLAQTWNAGGVVFTGIKSNVTNTASASGSKLLELQLGGILGLAYDTNGELRLTSYHNAVNPRVGFYVGASDTFAGALEMDSASRFIFYGVTGPTTRMMAVNSNNAVLQSGGIYGFSSTVDPRLSPDTGLARNGAGVIEGNNGTAGQWAASKWGVRDSGTTTVTNGLTIGHQSTGTPATGLGSGILFNIDSTTTADQNAGRIYSAWTTATHASRTSKVAVQTVNNAGALTDSLVVTPTGIAILGTTTNDNATAGNVGEYISASVIQGSATALTTATPKTVTSISLTAGDWDVTGIGCITGASTGTEFDVAVGTTTNSLTGTVLGDTRAQTPTVSLAGADATLMIPAVRVSVSSTTTYYLIVQETFTIGSPGAYGRISARRVR